MQPHSAQRISTAPMVGVGSRGCWRSPTQLRCHRRQQAVPFGGRQDDAKREWLFSLADPDKLEKREIEINEN
jgi:hypothetical protein